jgi:DNA-binding NarL/FixJ family response regulator
VLIYSAFAGRTLAVAATVAGADGMLAKAAPVDELFEAMRAIARGGTHMPSITPDLMETCAARIEAADLPILGLRMDRTPPDEIAQVLNVTEQQIGARLGAMLGRLTVPTPV